MTEYLASKRKFISPNQFEALLETDFLKFTLLKRLFINLDNGVFLVKTYSVDVELANFDIFENYNQYSFQEKETSKVNTIYNLKKNDISDSIFEKEEIDNFSLAEVTREIVVLSAIKEINGRNCFFNFKKVGEGIVDFSICYKYYNESEKEIARETVALASAYANRLYSITFDTIVSNSKKFDSIASAFKKASLIVRRTIEHGEFTYRKDHFAPLTNIGDIVSLLKDDFYLDGAIFVYMERKQLLQTKRIGKGELAIEITNINGDRIPCHLYEKLDEAKETKYILFTNSNTENDLYENVKVYFAEDGKLHAKFFVTFYDLKSIEIAKKVFCSFIDDFDTLPKVEFDPLYFKTLDIKTKHLDMRYMSDWSLKYETF